MQSLYFLITGILKSFNNERIVIDAVNFIEVDHKGSTQSFPLVDPSIKSGWKRSFPHSSLKRIDY